VASYRELYLQALPRELRARWEGHRELDAELDAAIAAAAETGVAIDPVTLCTYLAARADAPVSPAFPHAAELALASAIGAGDAVAIRLFEERYLSDVPAAVRRLRLGVDELDELKQVLRRQLLVADGDRPARIGDYSGRGSLAGWLRVAALRAALKLRRGAKPIADEDALEHVAAGEPSPELDVMTEQTRGLFRAALREAIASLDAQDQNVLRQHHLDGLTLDQLGALYRVHRSTVAYWLSRAREQLFRRTRSALLGRGGMSAADCESLFRHASSRFAVTMRGLFTE
jgi:RNA polymerase sigma-70 factor, ECF subfamily